MFDIQIEVAKVYELNEKWWRDIKTNEPIKRDDGELFMLMVSELSEAMEGERKNLMDDKLPQFPMAGVEMVDFVIRILDYAGRRNLVLEDKVESVRNLLPWAIVRKVSTPNRGRLLFGMVKRLCAIFPASVRSKQSGLSMLIADARLYCEHFGYPFEEMYRAKFEYNVHRADHKHENRVLENGKKF